MGIGSGKTSESSSLLAVCLVLLRLGITCFYSNCSLDFAAFLLNFSKISCLLEDSDYSNTWSIGYLRSLKWFWAFLNFLICLAFNFLCFIFYFEDSSTLKRELWSELPDSWIAASQLMLLSIAISELYIELELSCFRSFFPVTNFLISLILEEWILSSD